MKNKNYTVILLKMYMYVTYTCPNIIFKFRLAVDNSFGETTILDEKNTSKNTFLAN